MSEVRIISTRRSTMRALSAMFAGLEAAEAISRDVAQRQSALAHDAKMRRFFERQAAQEAVHARIFDIALRVVSPRMRCPGRLARALAAYRARLDADLGEARLGETMIGLQGVFEALGEVALRPAEGGIAALAARFVPLRGVLLEQERMHRRYGCYFLRRIAATEHAASPRLARAHDDYAAHAEAVLAASVEVFDAFPLDQQRYLADGRRAIRSLEHDLGSGAAASTSTS